MQDAKPELILVTGATGYLSSHVIKILLDKGHKVRGTVRSLANKAKYEFLYNLSPDNKDNLTFAEAELTDAGSWTKALEDVTHVLHIASPIPPYVPKHEDEVIKPAVEGTINVLNASLVNGGVKKFILTSSCLALFFGNEDKVLTESDWSDPTKCFHYPKSKVLAEKAGWELWEQNKDKIQFAVVCPSLILGPTFTTHGNASEAMVAEFLKGTYPGIPDPDCNFAVVDVRDTAMSHYLALFSENSNGQRYISAGHNLTVQELVEILKPEFGGKYKLPTEKVTLQQIKDSGNPVAQRQIMLMGKKMKFSNKKIVDELGQTFRKIEDTIVEMANSLIKSGVVPENKQ